MMSPTDGESLHSCRLFAEIRSFFACEVKVCHLSAARISHFGNIFRLAFFLRIVSKRKRNNNKKLTICKKETLG